MSLTEQQKQLVKGTIPALREHGEHISTVFYKTMLRDHPDLHNYFNAVNMQNGSQPRALTALILAFASNISDTSELAPKLERVAHKHVSLGIQPEQYEIVAKHLMRAFSAVLGPAMTAEVRTAWTNAYWIMARMLTNREAQIYRDFEKWNSWRRFIIDKRTPETKEGDIVSFRLKPVDGAALPKYLPGQYVSVRVRIPGSSYLQIRQYSLSDASQSDQYRLTIKRVPQRYEGCSCDRAPSCSSSRSRLSHSRSSSFSSAVSTTDSDGVMGIVDFGVRKQGVVSNLLINGTQEGDVLELSHPAGDFYLDTENSSGTTPLVLISAGVGVSPIMSMLNTTIRQDPERPISWIQGSKNEIPFQEHVQTLAKSHPNLRTTFFTTGVGNEDMAESKHSSGYGYYLQWLKEEDMFFDNNSAEYWICGPERFMLDISTYLRTNGVSDRQVRFELHSTGTFELASSK